MVYNVANELIKYKDKTKEVLKSVVESSKKHLEAIFSKIMGKSLGEVQKERTEALKAQKERERSKRQKEDRGKWIGTIIEFVLIAILFVLFCYLQFVV